MTGTELSTNTVNGVVITSSPDLTPAATNAHLGSILNFAHHRFLVKPLI